MGAKNMRMDAHAGNRKQKKHSYLERFDKCHRPFPAKCWGVGGDVLRIPL